MNYWLHRQAACTREGGLKDWPTDGESERQSLALNLEAVLVGVLIAGTYLLAIASAVVWLRGWLQS